MHSWSVSDKFYLFKRLLIMKLTLFLILVFNIGAFADVYSQTKISLNFKEADLTRVLSTIERNSSYHFVYSNQKMPTDQKVTINVKNGNVTDVLDKILGEAGLVYKEMEDHLVVIAPLNKAVESAAVQAEVITGVVSDKLGPLLGVTVVLKGTTTSVQSDVNGKFSITVPNRNAVLIFSMVGFATREVAIGNSNVLNVTLTEIINQIDEVIIVGYGTQKKQSVLGAISQVDGTVLQRAGGVSNIGAALTGNIPGITTIQSTGAPGLEDPVINIRGQSTWNNSSPLVLVDGIERSIAGLDIQSVQSISVLKDASATAVFGVKGANGVILVTTKRGAAGKANISVTMNATMKVPSRLPPKLDSYDALSVRNLAIERELGTSPASWANYIPFAELRKYRYPKDLAEAERYANVDWIAETTKKSAMSYNPNINISGGTEGVKYFTSVDYLNEGDVMKIYDNGKGYTPGFGYERLNVRSNLDFKLTKSTTLTANLAGLFGDRQSTTSGFEYTLWQAAYVNPPDVMMPRFANGNWGYYAPDNVSVANSAYLLANGGIRSTKTTQFNTDFSLNQNLEMFAKGLSFRGTISLDNTFVAQGGVNDTDAQQQYIYPQTGIIVYAKQPGNGGTNQFDPIVNPWGISADAMQNGSTRRQLFYQLQLNENLKFGNHNITAMGLFQRSEAATGSEFPNYREDWVFRTTYNFKSKYFLEVNGSYNGSEKFSNDHRFQFFPSLALGWTLSEEKFIKGNLPWVDVLRFRGSYGLVGNDNINGRWLYMSQWSFGGLSRLGDFTGGNSPYTWYRQASIGNPDVKWETVAKSNLALEYSFLNGVIAGSVDVFNDYRTDILIAGNARATPAYFGGVPPTANLGKVRTRGYEIELRLNKRFGSNLRVWLNANMTHAVDKVLDADDPQLLVAYQKKAGYQINQYKSILSNGFANSWDEVYGSSRHDANDGDKLPGNFNLVDFNGDGVVNSFDNTPYSYPERPQNTYNATLGFEYKGFSAFAQFYGVNNVTRNVQQTNFANSLNAVFPQGEYWTLQNPNADLPVPRWRTRNYDGGLATFYDLDGSYVRLKTAEIAYAFRGDLVKKLGVKSLRVFLNGSNLILWSKLPDDREANFGTSGGQGAYPTVRRYNLGFNVTL
jgi:TonB-linked SusC/RagA family outer membrane protein